MARRTNSDILTRFEDGLESGLKRHKKTIAAIAAAMGKPPPEAKAAVMVVQRGQRRPLRAAARITLEDGAVLCAHDALPGDLPGGYRYLTKIAPPS
jgi:antitoxin (DNA-binding transcriptional repressor) of toxin-antitoxin stability system